jgi:hypothetical protein
MEFCDRAIWLEKGQIKFSGNAKDAVKFYLITKVPIEALFVIDVFLLSDRWMFQVDQPGKGLPGI